MGLFMHLTKLVGFLLVILGVGAEGQGLFFEREGSKTACFRA